MKSRAITAMANRLIKSHGEDAAQLARTTSEQHRQSRDEYGALKWAEIAKAIERTTVETERREEKTLRLYNALNARSQSRGTAR